MAHLLLCLDRRWRLGLGTFTGPCIWPFAPEDTCRSVSVPWEELWFRGVYSLGRRSSEG